MNEDKGINLVIAPICLSDDNVSSYRVNTLIDKIRKRNDVSINNIIISNNISNPKSNDVIIRYNKSVKGLMSIYLKSVKAIINLRCNQKNILYYYGDLNYINIFLIITAKLIGYKIIFDIVEDNSVNPYSLSFLQRIKKISILFFRGFYRLFSDQIIVISWWLYRKYRVILKDEKKLTLIPISVDLNKFNSLTNRNQNHEFIVFYGGTIGGKNGSDILLKAFADFQKIYKSKLVFTGNISQTDKKLFIELVNEFQLSNKVEYLGKITYNKYINQLINCDVACIPRINNKFSHGGFPFKLGEILAASKPLIVTNVSDVSYYLTNMKNALIIDPGNSEQLYNALIWVYENRQESLIMGQEGKIIAEIKFNSILHQEILEDIIIKI